MGGTIAVTLRRPDGAEFRMLRWTNPLPGFVQHVRFLDADPDYIEEYMSEWYAMRDDYEANREDGGFEYQMAPCYFPGGLLASFDYGLVVVDFPARTLLHMQGYTSFTRFLVGCGPRAGRGQDEQEALLGLRQRGLLGGCRVFGTGAYVRLPQLPSEAALATMAASVVSVDVKYRKAGWTHRRFEESPKGCDKLLAAVRAAGFALNAEEEKAWKAYREERWAP